MTDYTELVKALLSASTVSTSWEKLMRDAAAAIEDLQKDLTALQKCYEIADTTVNKVAKQLPKRGEWKTTEAFPHRVYCSNCFRTYVPNDRWQIWVDKPGEGGLERNYCPSCGAKMTEAQE